MVQGIVQGVGFRPFVFRIAVKNNLVGYVRNLGDAGVRILAEGKETDIARFLTMLKDDKPPLARINDLMVNEVRGTHNFKSFRILKSSEEKSISGSIIPPDVAVCDNCLNELRDPQDRRNDYFFITCTDCGPRYTTITNLPYDRPNTTMDDFPMCEDCRKEYVNPSDRRFHAQTIACTRCGPNVWLTTSDGQSIDAPDPIRRAGSLLEEGFILAIKGNGGFHLATSTLQSKPLLRLRTTKNRKQKPFAIMARDIDTVKSFAKVSDKEEEILTSYSRPIVLLEKNSGYYLSEEVSPNLRNVGVMLPYTALHSMLFDIVKEPAFVMTSANPPSEPIVKDNQVAIEELGAVVDYFLLHNRNIAQRCDDSVVRVIGESLGIIRRSRGYAPAPVYLKETSSKCALGVGAELNVTSCVLLDNKAFISQHIGDVETFETYEFLKEATKHLIELTNSRIEVIGCDMHPNFNTKKLAEELGEKFKCPVIPVQHHYAHIASLMAEHGVKEMIGISCDGYGFGANGKAWGGEILHCSKTGFERLGHLEEQPMVGGDLATKYPSRMVAGILHKSREIEEWLLSNKHNLPYGEKEVEVILKQLESHSLLTTTSCGRILDAISTVLGVCHTRTYEGEPAMKLESVALNGHNDLNLEPRINKNVIDTTYLLQEVFDKRNVCSIQDLAYSAQHYLASSLAEMAVTNAGELGIKEIGFSGGVAYNQMLELTIRKIVEKNGLRFHIHDNVPPGDGGIAFGQAAVVGSL